MKMLQRKQKQKIVIEVPLHCAKCKKKIMEICTTAEGVTSVSIIQREQRDGVEIVGEGVDAARVTERLRDKVNKYAKLARVANVEESLMTS
ncbi:hypothetical protein RIF29_18071 [Crotalaria pallida]|uniref:HMA domain-containing protein n=1 Tax=Crotalaria pallida TaxID=3830 RepID=A0AAN9IF58_CROPI